MAAFKKSKILAVLKPGKTADTAENFRPISLLSVTYKLLERTIYNRISPKIHKTIPVEQAAFTPNRSTTEQVLAMTMFIEHGSHSTVFVRAMVNVVTSCTNGTWQRLTVTVTIRQ